MKRTMDDLEREEMGQIHAFVHYRIALKWVCLPLRAVTSSRRLVSVVGDCIEGMYRAVCMVCRVAVSQPTVHIAHQDATEKSKLIHRNISNESVAILPTFVGPDGEDDSSLRVVWRGILTDWEFATPVATHNAEPRPAAAQQRERTPVRLETSLGVAGC